MSARLLIATRSAGKARELRGLLALPELKFLTLDEIWIAEEVPEHGATFDENATHKALTYARLAGLPVIADDSGLEVDALDGEPGVRTRRFAGPTATDGENNAHLLKLLVGVPPEKRTARYRCVLAFAEPSAPRRAAATPSTQPIDLPTAEAALVAVTHGTLEGRVAFAPKGSGGFGYDPLFEPVGEVPGGRTLAEYSPAAKNRISHRGRAARAMRRQLARWLVRRDAAGRL